LPDKIVQTKRIGPWALAAAIWIYLLYAFFFISHSSASSLPEGIAEDAIARGLFNDRGWHTLLHYRPRLPGSIRSAVDDPAFFLSPDGSTSPADELRATIVSFLTDDSQGDSHPICRFPARLKWLREHIPIDDSLLSSPRCEDLDRYMAMVNPVSATLVFPESHINSPASMFGHTLIRLDSHNESSLLSYSVSYSAVLPDDPGSLLAFKGVFGAYKGSFTVMPYYEKIKEYSHMESRDIWEYGLDLTPQEVRRMALHIWELRHILSDYYFFDDNCSYALLFLIESARPTVDLTGEFSYWVLPTDTIRVLDKADLINSTAYRPSKSTRITHMESLASQRALVDSLKLARGLMASSDVDSTLALDLAAEYIQQQYMDGTLHRDQYTTRFLDTLSARSTFGKQEYLIPAPAKPESGHETAMLSVGGGQEANEGYAALRWRLAYHGLMDPGAGYKPGAAIEFLSGEARYFSGRRESLLQRLMLIEITSLSQRGNFFKPVSWRVRFGAEREVAPSGDRTPIALDGGAGLTAAMGEGGLMYFMLEPSLKTGGGLSGHYALGGGLSAGVTLELAGLYRALLIGRALYYPAGDRHSLRSVSLRQGLRIAGNVTFCLDYSRARLDGLYQSDSWLGINLYF